MAGGLGDPMLPRVRTRTHAALLLVGLAFGAVGCVALSSPEDEAITRRTGVAFAEHLVAGRFEQAHQMLGRELAARWTPATLRDRYQEMVAYGDGPIIVPGHTEHLARWPDRQPKDHGWIYVSITGTGFAEAVTVVVTNQDGAPRIRQLEWGRP